MSSTTRNNSSSSGSSSSGGNNATRPSIDLPLYAISGLSHILTTHQASNILGEATVRNIVRSFLRCTASLLPPNKKNIRFSDNSDKINTKDINFENVNPLLEQNETEDESYWTDIFTSALMHNFSPKTNTKKDNDNDNDNVNMKDNANADATTQQKKPIPAWCSSAWHRLMNLPSLQTYTNLTVNQQQHLQQLNSKIPFPLIGLDKSTFIKSGILFANCIAPHGGTGGHLALMECVFHALATPPPTVLLNRLAKVSNTTPKAGYTPGSWREHMKREYARAIVEGPSPNVAAKEASSHMKNNQRTILLLPDLIIYWGIVRQYQNVFNSACIQDDIGSGDCDSDGDGDDDSDTCIPKGLMVMKEDGRTRFTEEGSGALLDIAKIMFRIYEAFQKKGHVSRDTVQRFLTDICGEGTPEQPNVKQVLERMYTIKDKGEDALAARHLTQLSENQFIQSLRRTVHIAYASDDSPKGLEHILIDWFIRLASTMMPGYLSDMKRFFSSSPQSVGIGTLLKAKLEMLRSSTADTEVMKLYRKFDISEDGAGFRSNSSSMKKSSSMALLPPE